MGSHGDNAYLHARVSVLADQLLAPHDIERLADLDLEQIGRQCHIGSLTEDLASDQGPAVPARLRAVQQALINSVLSELSVLIRPMYGEARELVVHWARKFELFNLKALIRGKLGRLDEAEIQASLHQLPPYLALPHQTLVRTESVLELLRQLEAGPYRAIASQARQVFEEHHETFALESVIDQRYYAGMVKRVRQLQGEDLKETQKVVGLHLDRVNLMWMLRYRYTYGLSPSETYFQLVPSPLRLHRERLLALVNLPSMERLLDALPDPLNAVMAGADSTAEVERRIHALTSRKLRGIVAHNPSPVARSFAYLVLRELDTRRLFSVIQGRLLGLDQEIVRLSLGLRALPAVGQAANA